MSIEIKYNLEKDNMTWINDEKPDRLLLPWIVKIRFYNSKSGQMLFQYVPKIEDYKIFEESFKMLSELDELKTRNISACREIIKGI